MKNSVDPGQKVAIIGMAARLPGADNVSQFWDNLLNGVDSISTFTDDELRKAGVPENHINSPNYVRRRGIINGAEYFDAAFFGITPRDAEIMDPQHRVFLECAWHALEDAGYDPEKSEDRIGVFGGTGVSWHLNSATNNPSVKKYASGTSIVTGNDKDYLATRVSYKLNLRGPSLTVQSACSTSMAAVVLGMNSLLNYQSDLILAGGATIELPERRGYLYQEGGLESSDGVCRTFDKDADGTVFSRGAGVVLLKRYEDAVRDGDHIYAVLLGGAINNDGNSKVGFTAPSVEGQVQAAIEAIELSGITADTITYVEAHGTATNVGDPIEVSSLTQVFQSYSNEKQFCALGSVKTNIGHTDSASGVAGLIKAALSLYHKKIVAHLNYHSPNPKIDFENSPFFVTTETIDWTKPDDAPRRALINSFGVGGTNACVVLEEPPAKEVQPAIPEYKTLFLSAKSDEALHAYKQNVLEFVELHPDLQLDDFTYTYQVGRRFFNTRGFLAFKDRAELIQKLAQEDSLQRGYCEEDDKPIIFMFPGQGNQYHQMGADLYRENTLFRETVDYCADYLKEVCKYDLRDFIFAEDDSTKAKIALEQTYITQPAIFVISYAMAKVVMSKGIYPEALIGHSVGEYVAACISGIMSLEDALKAVAKRGLLIQDLPGGSMLAVLQNEDKVLPFLFPGVEVAAVNNPGLCVVAGTDENIDKLEAKLEAGGFFSKRLSTSHAFHSEMMEPCLPVFAEVFNDIELAAPAIPIISTVTGEFMTDAEATNPDYWVKHVRKPVRFTDAVKTCLEMNPSVFFEVGPGQSLESAVKRHLEKDSPFAAVRSMPAEKEKIDDNEFLAAAIGNLWVVGATISWADYYQGQERSRLPLPLYPYQRAAYSIDFSKSNIQSTEKTNIRFPETKDWYSMPVWKRSANVEFLIEDESSPEKAWLVFQDQHGLGYELTNQLLDQEQQVIEVYAGSEYLKKTARQYTIDPSEKAHYEQLIKNLSDQGVDIGYVVHLLNYSPEDATGIHLDRLQHIEDYAFFSPLFLEQALYEANMLKEVQFSVVANGAFNVIGEKVYAPEKSLAIGPCRVLIQEFPHSKARFIDVDFQPDTIQRKKLAKNIILESKNKTYQTLVAYRNNHRWIEGYDRVPFKNPEPIAFKEGGIYLITGGLGGIGILTARAIADEVNATFVLTYNSPIPERAEWDKWLEENPGPSFTRDKIEGIRSLESIGSKVLERQVNVADFEGMQQLLNEIERTAGRVNGVIHSAGTVGGGIIPLKTAESVRPVFDSKFRGTVILDKIFEGRDLDFFVLYSSITSILGESTRLDYCAGNAFLDSFASYRKYRLDDRTTSINWAGWVGTGMAVRWEKEKAEKAQKTKTEAGRPNYSEYTELRPSIDMLKLVEESDDRKIYEVDFKPKNDWIINSHFIINQPTVVGTTFIELAHQFGKMALSGQYYELRNLYFISPLMFENGRNKKVRFIVDRKADKYKFSFKTQPLDKNSDKDIWHDHFLGELVVTGNGIGEFDLEGTKKRLSNQIDTSKGSRIVYNAQNQPLIDLGDRWDIDNEIYVGEGEWLTKLTLRSEFNIDTEHFDYHPAIMDKATSFALRYTSNSTFLPFSYKSVKPYGKLPAEVYAYARPSSSGTTNEDTAAFDITLIDGSGKILMEITEYTMKQVNDLPSNGRNNERDKAMADMLTDTFDYINPDQGEDAIKHILKASFPEQLIVYPCDFDFMLEDNLPDLQKRAEEKEKQANKSYYSRPALSTPYEEPANEMEKTIAEIWQDILGLEKVGRNDTFNELGGNSLLAIQTIANIVDVLEVELSAQVFYDNPTVAGLAGAVVSSIMNLGDMENLEELIESMGLEDV